MQSKCDHTSLKYVLDDLWYQLQGREVNKALVRLNARLPFHHQPISDWVIHTHQNIPKICAMGYFAIGRPLILNVNINIYFCSTQKTQNAQK